MCAQPSDFRDVQDVVHMGRDDVGDELTSFPTNAASLHLSARSLSYFVPDKTKKKNCCCLSRKGKNNASEATTEKQILHSINFDAKPGELTAILGPSGSGKTTLLDCLAGRMSAGRSEGDILLNSISISEAKIKLKALAGYVKQKDLLFSTATPRELITYAALMRLPSTRSREEKLQRVEEVLAELGLLKCADTRLGSAADGGGGNVKGGSERGVSGGELKRVAIAIELITQPALLFLDEPTSGLDASAAANLIRSLKRLAESGCTIVSTLHQPRSSIWQMFDRVVLMKDGQIVFSGKPSEAITFFAKNGWECPTFTNPADYVLDVISELADQPADSSSSRSKKQKTIPQMVARFRKKQQRELDKEKDDGSYSSKAVLDLVQTTKEMRRQRPGVLGQLRVLFVRAWRNNLRNSLILGAQLGQHVILAIFCGLMYLQVGPKSIRTSLFDNATIITDRAAALFFTVLNISFIASFTEAFVFPAERPIFNRERASGHYGVLSYYLALTFANLPLQVFFVVLNASISYWLIGFRPDFGAFILFIVLCLLCTLCLQGATLVFSALSPSADVANLFMGLILLLFMSFAGFFLSLQNIPVFFKPFEYISPYKYGYRALLVNDLSSVVFNCTAPLVPPSANFTAPISNVTLPAIPNCPYPDGAAALKYLGMTDSSILADSMILLGMIVIYRILVYIVLLFVKVGGD